MSTRILLVEDHPVVRQAVATFLTQQPDLEVVGQAAGGRAAVAQTLTLHPDVVLMDIVMPDVDGPAATRAIKAESPHTRVIGLTMLEAAEDIQPLLEAGAEACISKTDMLEKLLTAIRQDTTSAEGIPDH